MSRPTRDTAATRSLRTRIESKSTGRLTLPGDLTVHLLHGDVLAATGADDDRQIVRMLHLRGLVDDTRAEDLESVADAGGDVFGDILAMGLGIEVDPILRERFVQNLCDFVSTNTNPRFVEQKGVFVANIQMGHDTATLLDEVCRLADLAKAIDVATLVVRGAGDPGDDPLRQAVAEALSTDPRSVDAILHEVPVEPTRARVVLAELLLDGVAQQPSEDEQTVVPIDEDDTLMTSGPGSRAKASRSPASAAPPRPSTPAPAPPRAADPAPSAPRAPAPPVEPEPSPNPSRNQGAASTVAEAPAPRDPTPPTAPLRPPEPRDEADWNVEVDLPEPLAEDASDPDSGPSGAAIPRSLSDYIQKTSAIGDDELDFFSDHDHERGGESDGRFKTDTHNLDKVEVGGVDPDEEAIEVEEAPSARFGAPPLTEDEAVSKIEVANDALRAVVAAFDEAEGTGRGRAVVQLLVDGVPNQFAALLHDLRIEEDGVLPHRALLRNLGDRPQTEHRQLLNNSLVDIIERALSSAADELPDEAIDQVLEAVAGYRSRMGL